MVDIIGLTLERLTPPEVTAFLGALKVQRGLALKAQDRADNRLEQTIWKIVIQDLQQQIETIETHLQQRSKRA